MNVIQPFLKKTRLDSSLSQVNFNRKELEPMLQLYGQMVSKGEWRDYSISSSFSHAIFSVFRRSSEKPLYMIVKSSKRSKQNGLYSVVAMDGQIIKIGRDFKSVLQIFNKKLFKIV